MGDIVIRLSTKFQHQENMVNSDPPGYPAPKIATGAAEILQQVLAQNQDLMQILSTNSGKKNRKNTNIPLNLSTRPHKVQFCHPMPVYFDKYFCTDGRGRHKGGNWNYKKPGHKEKTTMENKKNGRNYGCTEWGCGKVSRVATNNNRNILLNST